MKELLMQEGYAGVTNVQRQGDHYTADAKGRSVAQKLTINAVTGAVAPQG